MENTTITLLETEARIGEILSLLEENVEIFSKFLDLGNSLISIREDLEAFERFKMHQAFNRQMHQVRSRITGIPVVVGFFEQGEAEELSLCEEIKNEDRFYMTSPIREIVIGRGCQDLTLTRVQAKFNLLASTDWGWEDGMGEHIEYYNAPQGIFYRESMSRRHHYALAVDWDGWMHPMDIYEKEAGNFSDADLRKTASLQGIRPYLGPVVSFPFFFGEEISDLPPLADGEERREFEGVCQHKHAGHEYWHPIVRIHREG